MSDPMDSSGARRRVGKDARRTLADFELPSEPGNERDAMALVAQAVRELGLPAARLKQLETAVAEATMNAMEHGNAYRPEATVTVRVLASTQDLFVLITDRGGRPFYTPGADPPDLDAKLQGLQSPRGWGLFLIQSMVDELHVTSGDDHNTVELILHLNGDDNAGETA